MPGHADEVKTLVDAAKANGFKIVSRAGGKHKRVLDRKGAVVVDENGPLILSGTPGDARWRVMTVKRWMKAGVLKSDPFKADQAPKEQKEQSGERQTRPGRKMSEEEKQALREAQLRGIRERSNENAERTAKVRAMLEPMIVKLGGWEKRGIQSELGDVLYHYGKHRGRIETPASDSSAKQTLQRIRRGETLSESNATLWLLLLDDIMSHEPWQPRYFELVREARGLVNGSVPAAGPPVELVTESPDPAPQKGSPLRPVAGPAAMPSLALEAIFWMSRAPDANKDEILDLGQKLLALEMEAQ